MTYQQLVANVQKSLKAEQKMKELILRRAVKIAAIPPKNPVKGLGFEREEIDETVFKLIEHKDGEHVACISSREIINNYGKIGFVPRFYCSPILVKEFKKIGAI